MDLWPLRQDFLVVLDGLRVAAELSVGGAEVGTRLEASRLLLQRRLVVLDGAEGVTRLMQGHGASQEGVRVQSLRMHEGPARENGEDGEHRGDDGDSHGGGGLWNGPKIIGHKKKRGAARPPFEPPARSRRRAGGRTRRRAGRAW